MEIIRDQLTADPPLSLIVCGLCFVFVYMIGLSLGLDLLPASRFRLCLPFGLFNNFLQMDSNINVNAILQC